MIAALVAAAEMPLEASAWFDLPGPELLSGREILERIAALRDRRILAVSVPLLTPRLSALWLKLVTSADYTLARNLVLGMRTDLLADDDRFWQLIDHTELVPFEVAARRALAAETHAGGIRQRFAGAEERLVELLAARKPRG